MESRATGWGEAERGRKHCGSGSSVRREGNRLFNRFNINAQIFVPCCTSPLIGSSFQGFPELDFDGLKAEVK